MAIDINPKDYIFWQIRGECKEKLNNYVDAIKDLNQSIELNPHDDHSFYLRAVCNCELGDFESAIDDLNKYGIDDFILVDYDPHPSIKARMAI